MLPAPAESRIGNGAKAQIEAQIAALGQNVIQVFSGNVSRGGFSMGFGSAGTLTQGDLDAIRKEIPGVIGISPEIRANTTVASGSQNLATSIKGVSHEYLQIRAWRLDQGDNFTETDVRTATKVAIIGKTTADTIFGDADPVGQIIRIKSAPFKIVGLLAAKGMSMNGQDQDDVLLVPYSSAMKRLTGATTFFSLTVQTSSTEVMEGAQVKITEILRERHKLGPDRDDDFLVRNQQEISEAATQQSRIMTYLLGSIAGVSLLVGGIGIMNIMLVSVTERTREIGVRMAIGARGRDILLQFLIEAVTLSVAGGVIGILTGVSIAKWVSKGLGWPTLISPESMIIAFLFSGMIGVFFGFYPARKASQLDPIDALRYE